MPEYNFNPGAHNPRFGGGDSLGVGKHPVVGSSIELKNAQSGKGGFLALTVTAIDGPEKGGTKVIRFNLHHENQDTVRIAEQQLAATCLVMGVTGPWSNTDILLNKPFVIVVVPQPGSDKYTEVNEVRSIDDRSVADCMKNAPASGGGGSQPNFAGGNNGAAQGGGAPAGAGGWGGGSPAQEAKTEPAATGGGWGQGATGGGAGTGGGASGWQQAAGGGAATGWGQSA